ANQAPVATFAMPVSALRFEQRVDVQARNFAEGKADVSVRGGLFENTGFRVGALSLFDPQTGHYFAELPIAPAMLGAPSVVVGADLAANGLNATTGLVAYPWRRIRNTGAAAVGGGEFGLVQGEFYQGYTTAADTVGRSVAADVAWAHSEADGALPYGDHVLDRVNGRLQLATASSQTDLFAGYQAKFFGWPNLYTPFNSNETEDLETVLFALNHRVDFGAGDFVEGGAYYRRNKDDYAFNRFAPIGPVRPFNHTTWVRGAAVGGRQTIGDIAWNFRLEALADRIRSTSLVFGPYRTRVLSKATLLPEKTWALADGADLTIKAGASYDHSNRDNGQASPIIELARTRRSGPWERLYFSYAQTTQVPTYTALKSNPAAGLFRGNATLGRETSRNVELGASANLLGWRAQAALFHRRDDDLVDWTFRRGVTARSANVVDIHTSGFEVVAHRAWKPLDVVLGYTWLAKDEDYRTAAVDASFYALNYARHRVTFAVTARLSRQFEVRFDNEVRFEAPNLLRTRGGERPLISSLGLAYRPAAWRKLTISVQADNLWDSDFQEVPAVPAAPRQVSGRVAYEW
ncbi:MAG TPA: TonB-dependent receptor, partial [Opitutus sp.]|nr:TonB-dependent receptor [Opitutus sp.]